MQCPRCLTYNVDTSKNCIKCGLPLPWFRVENTIGIRRAADNTAVIGDARRENNQAIIAEYKNSNNPLDILAVAFSYEREGASFRQQAISYFEKFLESPAPIPLDSNRIRNGNPVPLFSYWCIYSTLAILYEKEHDYDNAAKYLKLLPKESNYQNPADFMRIGNILAKIDINQAIDYYENLKKKPEYKKFKRTIDIGYNELIQKRDQQSK